MQKIATFLAILIALAPVETRANLITNGSFETTSPSVPPGSFINFLTGSTGITGWTVVGAGGTEVSVVSTTFSQGCCTFPAQDGSNWLDLTGDGTNNDTEGVEQTITTTVGHEYSLSFFVGNVFDPTGGFGTTSTANVSENGASLGAFENSCTSCTTQLTWEQFTTTFAATSTSTTLQFLNGDPSSDNSNGLDNVALVDLGAVPAPLIGRGLLDLLAVAGMLFGAKLLERSKKRRAHGQPLLRCYSDPLC